MTSRVLPALRRGSPAFVIAVLLWLAGRAHAAVLVAAAAALVLLLGLLAPSTATAIDRLLARGARAVAAALSYALACVALALAVLPVWGFGRLRTPQLLEMSSNETAWRRSSALRARAPDGTPLEPGRAGSAHTARVDSGHPLLTLSAALVVTALLTVGLVAIGRSRTGEVDRSKPVGDVPARARAEVAVEYDGLPVDTYAHEDEPFAPEMFGEYLQLPYRSDFFLGHRLGDFRGRYVNTVDGRRVSYTPDDPELTVWFFGGSTMFGIGQRDDHTLPSVVARLAEADGIRIRAVNFGISGYVNWQSLEQFEQALTSDDLEPPDLAVFYEGVNEWGLGIERTELGDVRPGSVSRLATSDEERKWIATGVDNIGPMEQGSQRDTAIVALSADQYRRGVETVEVLGRSYDVPVVHVWQPSPFAKVPNPADEELWRRVAIDPALLEFSSQQYREILRRSEVDAIDLTTALDDVDRPVYFDRGHTNELGARIIGAQMYQRLRAQMDELLRR